MPRDLENERYYAAVAAVMLPFLTGRHVAIEQRFAGSDTIVYRRHEGRGDERRWIRIESERDINRWARQGARGFHAHLRPEGPGAWFFLDIDSRELPTEMARIGAIHASDVLAEAGVPALIKFSGADGFHLMWEIPSLTGLGAGSIWTLEQRMVEALAARVAPRLAVDPRAEPLRAAVGQGAPLVATSSADSAAKPALLFDKWILKPNANGRVPYSRHAQSGLVSLPLSREQLDRFEEAMAEPAVVERAPAPVALPVVTVRQMRDLLAAWAADQ